MAVHTLTVVVGSSVRVLAGQPTSAQATTEEPKKGPNPLTPEKPELAWGAGSFVVFALLMRFVLFPKLKAGMDARYGKIRGDLEGADATRAAAHGELAEYHVALAGVKTEAAQRLDAVRTQLDGERTARLATVNAGIADRKAQAAADIDAAKSAASSRVADAVADVTTNAVQRLIGKAPDPAAVRAAVSDVMSVGVAR